MPADLARAWDSFIDAMRRIQRQEGDGCAPIALLILPATLAEDGGYDVERDRVRLLWPADFPIEDRGRLLELAAKPYRDGTVTR